MRKLSLLALAAFVSGAAFAQDAPAVRRNFSVYMDAISGNMIAADAKTTDKGGVAVDSPAGAVWDGSEYEVGMVYGQNWAKAPWLNTTFAIKAVFNPDWVRNSDGTTIGRSGSAWNDQLIRGQVGIDFTRYFSFYMDTRLLMGFSGQYAWTSGAHTLFFQLGVELFAGNYSLSGAKYKGWREASRTTFGDAPPRENAVGPIIDAVWLDILWDAALPKGFTSSFLIRPLGFGGDSGPEIAEKLYIRIQETISWSNAGFSIYARIRYNILNIAFPTYTTTAGDKYKLGIVHELSLRAGLSYSYDFSKL